MLCLSLKCADIVYGIFVWLFHSMWSVVREHNTTEKYNRLSCRFSLWGIEQQLNALWVQFALRTCSEKKHNCATGRTKYIQHIYFCFFFFRFSLQLNFLTFILKNLNFCWNSIKCVQKHFQTFFSIKYKSVNVLCFCVHLYNYQYSLKLKKK